jgi:hypothetical protein
VRDSDADIGKPNLIERAAPLSSIVVIDTETADQ